MSSGFDNETVFANRGDFTLLTVIQSEAAEDGFLPESAEFLTEVLICFGPAVGNTSSSVELCSGVLLSSPAAEHSIIGSNPIPSSAEQS